MDEAIVADVPVQAGPEAPDRRIGSVDVLRGVAVLGILAVNIFTFGLPPMSFLRPTAAGGFAGLDRAAWWTVFLLFYYKMMPVFSMLFGAGLVMMAERFRAAGLTLRAFWYRRMLWLMAFGLLHGYLLWVGDILFLYGFCGMAVYAVRANRPRRLLIASLVLYAVSFVPVAGAGYWFEMMRDRMPAIEEKLEQRQPLTKSEEGAREQWENIRKLMDPTDDELGGIVDTYRDGYSGIVIFRAPLYLNNTTFNLLFASFWPTAALMLAGMALMRWGVFSAARSRLFYLVMAVSGYGAGIPLAWRSAAGMIGHDFSFVEVFRYDLIINHLGGPLVALGHVALVMLFVRSGIMRPLRHALASTGRMALSNYLGQSLICTTFFFGYGLGCYDTLGKAGLMAVVVSIWVLQLIVSPLWLAVFRFGPAEWLWRSLTYWRRQPVLRRPRPVP
jgi:uncharacterized protein